MTPGTATTPRRVTQTDDALFAELARMPFRDGDVWALRRAVGRIVVSPTLERHAPATSCDLLIRLAETDLSLARLIEGHVNALRLMERLGDGTLASGCVLAVWGADGCPPARLADGRLTGIKRYASGLGIVDRAVVTIRTEDGTRLAVVPAADTARHDRAAWAMPGMRATVSGDFLLDGLTPEWLGPVDAYFDEPDFLGGVWRIAALQVGGTIGLLEAVRDRLAALGRLEADAQIARLAPLLGRSLAARGLVERAAAVAEGPSGREDPDRAVGLSVMARLLTEDLAQDAIAAAERAIGLRHFEPGSPTGRRARDLAVYCRQVARDMLEQKSGRIALGRKERLSELWHG